MHGRTVYGGGGIMPDIFVPNDTAGITSYYLNVVNAGLIQKYTFDYTDRNRDRLEKSGDVAALLRMLLTMTLCFGTLSAYSQKAGVAPRWYYINISRDLLVNQLKAMVVRNVLGVEGYFKVFNELTRRLSAESRLSPPARRLFRSRRQDINCESFHRDYEKKDDIRRNIKARKTLLE